MKNPGWFPCSLFLCFSVLSIGGCGANTSLQQHGTNACNKYSEKLDIMKSIHDLESAKSKIADIHRWEREYFQAEHALMQFSHPSRNASKKLENKTLDELKTKWSTIQEQCEVENRRIRSIIRSGTDKSLDEALIKILATAESNPF
jgi:aminoglycoside/choline kinase family phosphotransferase